MERGASLIHLGLGELALILIALLVIVALPVGGVVLLVLLLRGTQQKSELGINRTAASACSSCGTARPAIRAPKNVRQFLWGGWTCPSCGTEFDRQGQPLNR